MFSVKSLAAVFSATLILTACGGSDGAPESSSQRFDFDADVLIANLTDDVIVAGYRELEQSMAALHLAVDNLRNDPTEANLDAAQEAWKRGRRPWEQGEAYIFGPIDALSIDPHLDSWPLNTSDLLAQLEGNSTFDPDVIKTWNDDVQGFHTMEFLLFGDGIEDNDKSIGEMTASEREYLVALAAVALGYSQDLLTAWTVSYDGSDPYSDALKQPGNRYYSSELAVVEELIQGLLGIVDEVGNGKIADPFAASLAQADTSLVESQYSWNSLRDFSDNIIGVQTVYRGEKPGESDKVGLDAWVAAGDEALAARIDTEIQTAIDAILAIGGEDNMAFRQAIVDPSGRERVQAAVDALTTLQNSLLIDVLPLLSKWNG